MANAYLRSRIEERASLTDAISGVLDRAAGESRDLTQTETQQLETWEARCTTLDAEIAQLETRDTAAARFMGTIGRLQASEEREERQAANRRPEDGPQAPATFGRQFTESEAFLEYRGRGTMAGAVDLTGYTENRMATATPPELPLLTTDQLNITPTRVDVSRPWGNTFFLDALNREWVSTTSVEWEQWPDPPEAGGPIAEGDIKPQAEYVPELEEGNLETYAHWVKISRQALEDRPRVASIIEGALRFGLRRKLQTQALGAFLGGTYQTQPAASASPADVLAAIRAALGNLQYAGYDPRYVIVNPNDYAALDVASAGQAMTGPRAFGTFWGLTPLPASGVPQGTFLVADLAQAMAYFDRNVTSVYMTDSHADYFIRNTLVILAETRALFQVVNPMAVLEVTATGGDTGSGGTTE